MNSKNSAPHPASDWLLSLDLLIARAAIDASLSSELLENAYECCKANGVLIPPGVSLILTSAEQKTIIREIPSYVLSTEIEKVSVNSASTELAAYNSSTETTESNAELSVAEVECAEVTCELGAAVEAVTSKAAVVVIT